MFSLTWFRPGELVLDEEMVGRDGYMVMACWMGKDGGIDRFKFHACTLTIQDILQVLDVVLMQGKNTSSFHFIKEAAKMLFL